FVAQQVPSTILILGAWVFGGLVALAGAFIYAELSSQSSVSGGQYVYLRDAFHPALAFVYGWALLLVTQSGGMAAVAVTFAKYVCALGHTQTSDNLAAFLAAIALAVLTIINCFGVRAGSTTQNLFMILKLIAIAALSVMKLALGENGARIIAAGIAVSTIGFLSQSMLTTPRVYFAMAEDGLFFASLAKLNRARVPAFAIALQGAVAILITFSGRYEQLLNYVVSVDVIFFA